MRESVFTTRVMIAILCLGAAVYAAVYFLRNWEEPLITAYDAYVVVVVSDGKQQIIYKHAISTIAPERPVDWE